MGKFPRWVSPSSQSLTKVEDTMKSSSRNARKTLGNKSYRKLVRKIGRKGIHRIFGKSFYFSDKWLQLRYAVLKKYGRQCMLCLATNTEIHVDHIKPRSKYPELELEMDNLQVLCRDCNLGKSALDETDWRS